MITGGLTASEEWLLILLLRKVEQPYSAAFFEALAQLIPVMGMEAVILRERDGHLQALMTRRPDDDKIAEWAGKWHVPGTIVRVTDTAKADVFVRLAESEIGAELTNVRLVYDLFEQGDRGLNLQLIHAVDIAEGQEPRNGTWFDVDELPENSIDGHHEIILEVAARWRAGALPSA